MTATLDILNAEGPDALTLRRVAQATGVTHPALYRYYPDKSALLAAVAEEGFDQMREQIMTACGAVIDPTERLRKLIRAYVRFAITHPALFRVMFSTEPGEKWNHPSLRAAQTATFSLCLDAVIQGQLRSSMRAGDPREVALMGWSLMHGVASLVLDGMIQWIGLPDTAVENVADTIARMLFEGIGRAEPGPVGKTPRGE